MKKTLTMVLALALVFAMGVGATLAWLTAETTEVENTFTVGDINIALDEYEYADGALTDKVVKANEYKFVPGDELAKQPFVTVKADSEACWVFIEVTETNNTIEGLNGKVVSYTVDTAEWTQVPGSTTIWYKAVDATTADVKFDILTNDKVEVNENVTKAMVATINAEATQPKLTFDAYAHQQANTDLAAATQAAIDHFAADID